MRKFLYDMTSGEPKAAVPAIVFATLDSLVKLLPASIAYFAISEFFFAYKMERSLNGWLFIRLFIGGIAWLGLQLWVSKETYDKEYTAAYSVSASGRTKLANHLRDLSLGYLDLRDPGDLSTMLLGDYALVETAISHMVPQAFAAGIVLVIAFVSLVFVDGRMTLALFVTFPLVVFIIYATRTFQLKVGFSHIQAKVNTASRLQEYLQGIKEIKAYSLGGLQFGRLQHALYRLRIESIKIEGFLSPIVMSAISLLKLGLTILVFSGAYFLAQGSLSEGVFLAFLIIGSRIYDPFQVLMVNYTELRYAQISAARIMAIRNEKGVSGDQKLTSDQTIVFDHVHFAYQEIDVLHDVCLSIKPKTLTAFVGPSGSGKSTLVKLIARFYDVNQGTLSIGGVDLRNVDPDDLYQHISMVFQDVYLFKDTIRNNIRIGNHAASEKAIIQAAKQANCHDFIMKMPLQYDTLVGEGGNTLSGGEKQRISIARALLKQSDIILLDEATASLDLENEADVQAAISRVVHDKTVIIIAHRLKSIVNADQIVVLDRGRIVGQGSHHELMSACPLYQNLYQLQDQAKGWSLV